MKTETGLAKGVRIEFTETEPDGGGQVVVWADTEATKEDLCDIARQDVKKTHKYAPMLDPQPMRAEFGPRDNPNYGRQAWYAFPLALDVEWLKPYTDCLERLTGYAGPIPDMVIEDSKPLCFTRFRTDFRIEDGHLQATYYLDGHAYHEQTALEYNSRRAEQMFKANVGNTKHEREFVQSSNGQYKRNPNYLKQHPPHPALRDNDIWSALFLWWKANKATPGQLAVLEAAEKTGQYGFRWQLQYDHGPDYRITALDPNGTCNYDGKGMMVRMYSWEEFRAL